MATFKPGDRVRCINAIDTNDGTAPPLVEGQVYTVRDTTKNMIQVEGNPGLWMMNRFEPVEEKPVICTYKPGDWVRMLSEGRLKPGVYQVAAAKDGSGFGDKRPRIRVHGYPGYHYADRFIIADDPLKKESGQYSANPLYGSF